MISVKAPAKLPVLFVGHGSPMNSIEDNPFSREWAALGRRLPRPRAILCISAHWETRGVCVTAAAQPQTIHDFYGFPKALFDVRYPAPGSPALALRVAELLGAGPAPQRVHLDPERGYDHGLWSILRVMYPQADIPVVQLSLDRGRPGPFHLELGRRLAPLRREGVLILASGNIVHNLRLFSFHDPAPLPWAQRFQTLVNRLLERGDDQALANYTALGADAALAIPTPEHYLPLLYVLGARDPDEPPQLFNDTVQSSGSMTSVAYGQLS